MSVTDKQEQIAENQRMIHSAVYAYGFEAGQSLAVRYTKQTLTDEQQEQARVNIGAIGISDYQDLDEEIRDLGRIVDEEIKTKSPLVVTVDENNTASHSAAQVYAHVQKGGNVVLDYNGLHVALSAASDGSAYFAYTDDEHITTVYELWGNKIVEREGGSGSGGGSNVLTVFATGQDTASHNAGSVHGHLEKGGYVLFTYGEYIYTCAASSPAESTFIASMEGNEDLRIIKLYDDGSFEMFIATDGGSIEIDNTLSVKGKAADAKAVGDAIGDISSVLAELHAYAETLKCGGEV